MASRTNDQGNQGLPRHENNDRDIYLDHRLSAELASEQQSDISSLTGRDMGDDGMINDRARTPVDAGTVSVTAQEVSSSSGSRVIEPRVKRRMTDAINNHLGRPGRRSPAITVSASSPITIQSSSDQSRVSVRSSGERQALAQSVADTSEVAPPVLELEQVYDNVMLDSRCRA